MAGNVLLPLAPMDGCMFLNMMACLVHPTWRQASQHAKPQRDQLM